MRESQFLYIRGRKIPYEKFPWYVRPKGRLKYLLRQLPYEKREMVVFEKKGLEIELPFTIEQLRKMDETHLSDVLYRLRVETEIPYVAVEEKLRDTFPFEWVCDGKDLPLYLTEKIIDAVGKQENISKKDMHIVILAGDDIYTGFLLEKLGRVYNYLSLVATEDFDYAEKRNRLYEEYGLAVSVYDKESILYRRTLPDGDVFIDLTGKDNGFCRLFPAGARILDLLGEKDIKYYQGKREDLKIYNDFSFEKEEPIPSGLVQAALEQESSWLRKGALEEYCQLVEALDLKVFGIKTRFP